MKDLTCRSNEGRQSTLKYARYVLLCCVIIAAGVVLLTAQPGKIAAKDQKAAEAIKVAITALGGEKNIDNIKSLILTGTTKFYSGSAVDETEIRILLPDNYLRIDKRIVAGDMTRYASASKGESQNAAFNGTGNPMLAGISNEVNRFSCLLMGVLLKGDPVAPLTISTVAGASDRFSIAKESGALGEIEFDPKERYPLLISYKDAVRNVQPPLVTKTASSKPGKFDFSIRLRHGEEELIDSIMRFKDRVATNGVMFPETIVFESRGKAVSELKIEKVQINPKLTLADFEIPESL
jgi:hypothetical protein